jgi:hypothetical protein
LLFEALRNYWIGRKYGGYCGGTVLSSYAHRGAGDVQSLDYSQLSWLFSKNDIPLHPTDVFLDVGCGKGRIINWLLNRGVRSQIIGI